MNVKDGRLTRITINSSFSWKIDHGSLVPNARSLAAAA
jgi:hypothetical protein